MFKSLFKSDGFRRFLCAAITLYIRVLHRTGAWRTIGEAAPEPFWREGRPFILAFWHSRLLMVPFGWPSGRASVKIAISRHRDGDIIANSVAPLGIGAIRGSAAHPDKPQKEKGGAAAFRTMVRALKSGEYVGVTPDGPRGPREQATAGAVRLAALTGAPVIPFAYAASNARTLNTWDRFHLPLPFARGFYVWGEPLYFERSEGDEALAEALSDLETGLNRVTEEADRLAREPIKGEE